MALIDCPECKKTISSAAIACPFCGVPLVCPECGRKHPPLEMAVPVKKEPSIRRLWVGLLLVAAPILASGIYWKIAHRAPAVAAIPASPASMPAETVLRFVIPDALGPGLVSALAEAYLTRQGAARVWRGADHGAEEVTINGSFPADNKLRRIEIAADTPGILMESLASGQADIVLSAGRIKPEDAARLNPSGNKTADLLERVLAADGLAVIVGRDSPVAALSRDQIAAILSGIITDWKQVKQQPGKINVHVPDVGTDGFATLRVVLPGVRGFAPDAVGYKDPVALSEAVAKDANGIGIVGIPYRGEAKSVAIAGTAADRVLPTSANTASGAYPLTRYLYLYSLKSRSNAHIQEFFEFTASQPGRDVMGRNGYVAMTAWSGGDEFAGTSGDEYARLTAEGLRLSFDIRFRPGSVRLDHAARMDLERARDFLRDIGPENYSILVFGFSDSRGNPSSLRLLSRLRAQRVAQELKRYGLDPTVVTGFGSSQPVAGNDTAEGRDRNRRVEIWLKKENRPMAERRSNPS